MFFYRNVIAAISSTLFVVSNGYTEKKPLFFIEQDVQARELDSSCSCEFSDLVGSDMSLSCDYLTTDIVTFTVSSFGEEESIMELSLSSSGVLGLIGIVHIDDNMAIYSNGAAFMFVLDPTAGALEDGECSFDANEDIPLVSIGCWACPVIPTDIPTSYPSNHPSNHPSNQPSVNPESDGECCCCEETKDPRSLLHYSLKALFFL